MASASRAGLFLWLLALLGAPSCYAPNYDCRLICSSNDTCPAGLGCYLADERSGSSVRICRRATTTCEGLENVRPVASDAGGDAGSAADALPPAYDAVSDLGPPSGDALGTAPETAGDGGAPPGADGPIATGVPDRICYPTPDRCLELTPALRAGLALWLDPANLPAPGAEVTRWVDRSGRGHVALPLNPGALPLVVEDGVGFSGRAAMQIAHHPGLELGSDDFSIFVVARMNQFPPTCLLATKRGEGPEAAEFFVGLFPALPLEGIWPRVQLNGHTVTLAQPEGVVTDLGHHLVHAARAGDLLSLVVDQRASPSPISLPTGASVLTGAPWFLGTCHLQYLPVAIVNAVVMVRGRLPDGDRQLVSQFLLNAFPVGR